MNKGENSKKITELAIKAGIWYTISSILLRAIGIITTPIYTRIISVSDYGIFANFNSWITLLSILCSFNLVSSVGRARQDFKDEFSKYISSLMILATIITMIISSIIIIFIDPISKFIQLDNKVISLMVLYLIFIPSITFIQSKYRFEYKYKQNIFISVYITISTIVISLLTIYYIPSEKYLGRIIGTVIPIVFLGLILLFKNFKQNRVFVNISHCKYGLSISIPLIVHVLSLNILSQSDRILIANFCGSNEAGIYSLAYQYSILISIITNSICEAWQPWFFDKYSSNEINEIKMGIKPIIILGCFITIGCIAIAPEAIFILGGVDYKDGIKVVYPVVIGILCQYIYTHYVNVELYLKKTKYISMGTVGAAIINIILNIILIPKYGYVMAGYTTLISYLILMLLHFMIVKKVLKIRIYNNKFLFAALGITMVISCVFVYMYNYILLRYGMILIFIIIYIIANRKIINRFIKKKKEK